MTAAREAELLDLIRRLCDRLYAAHEVLANRAERRAAMPTNLADWWKTTGPDFERWWKTSGPGGGRRIGHPAECLEAWRAAYRLGMERAAEICNAVAGEFEMGSVIDALNDAADAIRAEAAKETNR